MNFHEYQTEAHKTAKYKMRPYMKVYLGDEIFQEYSTNIPSYPFIKVMAESAEIAQPAIKSALRGDDRPIDEKILEKEIGDLLWYCAEMATLLGVSLEYIAESNIEKLKDRDNRNQIKGSGDNR